MARPALMVYIEPTPYVLGFVRCVAMQYDAAVDILFITSNLSQEWNLSVDVNGAEFLPCGRAAAAWEIARRIASGRYGVLHLAGWGHPLLLWALIVGAARGVPIAMESDTQLPAGSPLWKRALKRTFYPLLFRIPRILMPAGTRQAAYFHYYGAESSRIVKAQMTVDVEGIARLTAEIRNGHRLVAARNEWGLPASATVFLFVGRLEDPRKGISTLLAAFEVVSRTRDDVALLIVGDGTARSKVEAAVVANPRIRYAGRLDPDGVARALACTDVAVVPSMIEPFGLVVNEAMAAGLPVVVSDRVGCADDLVHPDTGVIFRAGNVDELVSCMVRLVGDSAERSRMGAAARQRISRWTLDEQARIALKTWKGIMLEAEA